MERIEEYLEAIYDIQDVSKRVVKTNDLAKKLGVKPSSVTEMLLKLNEKGYVEYQPYYGVFLTDKGLEVAKRIKRFHKIFETFFSDFLGLNERESHRLSCELEHHVTEEVAERICMLISSAECIACSDCERSFYVLRNAPDGLYEIVVAPLIVKDLGFQPGKTLRKSGKDVFLGEERFLIDESISSKIVVRVLSE